MDDDDLPQTISEPDLAPPRLRRFLGFVVDYLILAVIGTGLSILWGHTVTRIQNGKRVKLHETDTPALWVYAVIVLAYVTVSLVQWGRTPGMYATGLEVTDRDGRHLTWQTAFLRGLIGFGWLALPALVPTSIDDTTASVLSWILLAWPFVVFGPIMVDPSGRGLHDRAVGSEVVRSPNAPPGFGSFGSGRGGGFGGLGGFGGFGGFGRGGFRPDS
jgi:uncharacterized RDD family membrane protein YckC